MKYIEKYLLVIARRSHLRIVLSVVVLLTIGVQFAFFRSADAVSTTPTTMNFQGRLTNSAGNIMADGLYNMKFRIYDAASAGTLKWSEVRETTNRVQVTNGLFSVQLGQVTPLDPTIFASGSLYFEIELPTPGTATCSTASCGTFTEGPMTPRNKLSTSAYAYNAETLDGLDSSAFALATGGTGYIQNTSSPQTANFNITGTGTAGSLQAASLDAASSGALTIGGVNATSIALVDNVVLNAGFGLTITGGVTGTRPASPSEGTMYFDTTTKQLLTFSNGKWKAANKASTLVVAASNSSQELKDAADYVATGTGDQAQINSALTAAAGGVVYLVEGTYTVNASISVPSNTVLSGAGMGTVITIPNTFNTSINIITNTSAPGTGVTIRDLSVNGNKANNTIGTDYGAYLNNVGYFVDNVSFSNMRNAGIAFNSSSSGKVTNSTFNSNDKGIVVSVAQTGFNNNIITNNAFINNINIGFDGSAGNANTEVNNILSNNTINGGVYGISINSNYSLAGNMVQNTTTAGIQVTGGNNTVTGSNIQNNATYGVILNGSSNNTLSGNKFKDNGGLTNNDAIFLGGDSDSNTIVGNNITDASATTTNYAININATASDNSYLADNILGTGAIRDTGTGTIYANQQNSSAILTNSASAVKATSTTAFQVQNAAGGTTYLGVDTSAGLVKTESLQALTGGAYAVNQTLTAIDDTTVRAYSSSTAVASDGFARITYYDETNLDLVFVQCTNSSCSTKTTTTIDSTGNVGNGSALAIGSDGFARIVYYDSTNTDLKFIQCTNASCSTRNTTTVDNTSTAILADSSSIALGSDTFARIIYRDGIGGSAAAKFIQCTNASCSTKVSTTVDATFAEVSANSSLAIASDGFARFTYADTTTDSDLTFVQCTNAACSTKNTTLVDTTGVVGGDSSMELGSDGFGRITYFDDTNDDLKFAQCTNAACSTSNITVVDPNLVNGPGSSTDVASDGFVRIAYKYSTGSTSDLRFIQCTNASCSTKNSSMIDQSGNVGGSVSMMLGADDFARITYADSTNNNVKLARLTSAQGGNNYSGSSIGSQTTRYGKIFATSADLQGALAIQNNNDSGAYSINLQGGTSYIRAVDSSSNLVLDVSSSNFMYAGTSGGSLSVKSSGSNIGGNGSNYALTVGQSGVGGGLSVTKEVSDGSNLIQANMDNTDVFTLSTTAGEATFTSYANSATAFRIQRAGGTEALFTGNTSSNQVKIGNNVAAANADVAVLVLDNAVSTYTPTGVAGAMYYDSTNNKFKCYTTTWVDCDTAANGVTTVGAFTGASIANGASISANTITLGAADGTNPGLVTIGNQTLAGNKTLTGTTTTNDIEVAAGKFVHLTGGITGTRPASPTEGMIYFDSTTKQLLTYANGKWKSAGGSSTKIVAASNSSQALKDGADYVATGTGDQTIINNALTAAAGGAVYLAEGTYSLSGTILVPDNTALSGAGDGTLLTIPNAQNGNYQFIKNSNVTTGTGVTVSNLKIDGNKANQTSATNTGIRFDNMGAGSGGTARKGGAITNVTVVNVAGNYGIHIYQSSNNTVTNNTVQSGASYGVYLDNSPYNTVSTNNILGNATYGIYISLSDYNKFADNALNNNAVVGLGVSFGVGNTMTGNTIIGGTKGFEITSGTYSQISANKFMDTGSTTATNAIWLSNSSNNTITSNSINDTSCSITCDSITTSGASGTGNYISDNGNGGLDLNDTGTGTVYIGQQNALGSYTNVASRIKVTSGTALNVQNASAANFFTVDTSTNKVQIGSATTDATAVQFILDSFNSTTEPTGTNGAMYYNTALAQYRCFRDGDWEPCATKPIDRSFILEEEFISGAFAAAGSGIGNLNWVSTALTAGGCGNFGYNGGTGGTAVSADRPGILKLTTAATINAGCRLALGISGANTMMLAPGQVIKASGGLGNAAANTATLRIGADGSTTAQGQWSGIGNSGVWWEADPTVNANWRYCYVNSAGTAVCAASGVAIATNVLARLEIKINAVGTNTSNMDFIINGTTSNVSGVTLNTTGTVRPDIVCYAQVAVAQGCYVDYYLIRGDATAAR